MVASKQLSPTIIVIFGITGDLSKRYLLPALYHLIQENLLHAETEIIGISRRDMTLSALFDGVELCGNEPGKVCDPVAVQRLHDRTRMFQMDPAEPQAYAELLKTLNAIEADKGLCMNRLYYLSIPPQVYGPIIHLMGQAGLNTSCPHDTAMTRLLVEKPFGYDLASAEKLITETSKVFSEEQIYRIDHYLAKETVQNILTFRFQNPIFESSWNNASISRIEISASEQIGIEGRAHFYEPIGALRDFIQNHLLQIMAIVTMDKPAVMDSEHIHASKQALLESTIPVAADVAGQAYRAQYDGYRQEVANPTSTTETFAAIQLRIESDRWQGVPIIIWTGKALDDKKTEISVSFKGSGEQPNILRFRIQPNEGIELDLLAKKPGFDEELQTAVMNFSYQDQFDDHGHPNAYERVLVDAVRGDHTLFATSGEVLAAWRVVQPVLDAWAKNDTEPPTYAPGISGKSLIQPLLNTQ